MARSVHVQTDAGNVTNSHPFMASEAVPGSCVCAGESLPLDSSTRTSSSDGGE
jgi:hypothetical protein